MTIEDLVKLIIAITSGGLLVKILDWVRDARQGHLQKRRAEVDAAIAERDKARVERDVAIARVGWLERWVRILEEALALARRRFIDAPCTDPDELDPYPSRPDRDTS
ncbi:hypothetical protein [Microbacterium sp. 5K110]|uniref:hypothetical protein n=1 Tax=Microbacterium sp. 5K110 TaxID=2578104 RepID=UPI0010FE86AC|nr:hypothetical protein [Microbacterium sp. 5K110]TLF33220.1 hypothetical protein FE256_03755 [Microbacterium sp. 5K110]